MACEVLVGVFPPLVVMLYCFLCALRIMDEDDDPHGTERGSRERQLGSTRHGGRWDIADACILAL
jgi:hypothetical protein